LQTRSNYLIKSIYFYTMPIPKVQSGEKQTEYIQRCLEAIGSEYQDKDQAVAVCYTQYREGK
jgi:hypothetical protein